MYSQTNQDVADITTPKKLTRIVSLIATTTSLFIGVITYFLLEIRIHVPLVFVAFSVFNAIIYWVYRVTENLKLVYILTSALIFIGVYIISIFSGGISSSFSFFLPIVVISGYSMNIRYGNRWLAVSLIAFVPLYLMDQNLIQELNSIPEKSQATFSFISMLLATVMLCAIYGRYLSNSIYKSLKKTVEISEKNKENETLLNEVQSRVNGNLKIIRDMMSVQSKYVESDDCKKLLDFSIYRVKSMAIVHDMLYRSDNVSQINFKEYLSKLSKYLMKSLGGNESNIIVRIESEKIFFNMDTAVPLALLTTEILTNAFKYSLENKTGTVSIKLDRLHFKNYILEIGDNGKGVSEELQFDSIGKELIESLANKLNGHVEKVDEKKPGANFMVVFQEI